MLKKRPKIAVALSGGVDSSVSAWLLKKQGFDVVGFFMNLGCGSSKNARNFAENMEIPFFEVDTRKKFQKEVMDYFVSEYRKFNTPNPCVICNERIKFGRLLETAKRKGFDRLATGHYCRVEKDRNGIFHLLAGIDENKDQSYFLYRLNQKQLSRVVFPLGNLTKGKTKETAKKNNIAPDNQSESQEICFLGGQDYRLFLKDKLPKKYFKSGDIIDINGKIIGRHGGLINYTIGQRKGIEQIGIKDENKRSLYVVGCDKEKNALIVGPDKNTYSKKIELRNICWISSWAEKKAMKNSRLKARIRYRHAPASCKIFKKNNKLVVEFKSPQRAIAGGQSLVFYSSGEVLGGGIMK